MKRVFFVALAMLALAGCSNIHIGMPDTFGSFVYAPEGKEFAPVEPVDPRNAIVYIYRPISEWGYAEVQAPSLFINEQELFGLKSGAYSWVELPAGDYDFYARRPLSILYLKTIFDMRLHVEGGRSYFFRYSELHPLEMQLLVNDPHEYASAGPLQEVPNEVGLRQIAHLKLDEPGVFYGAKKPKPRWAPFYTYPPNNLGAPSLLGK